MNLDKDGCELWDGVISQKTISTIKADIEQLDQDIPRYGVRSVEKLLPSIHNLTQSKLLLGKASSILGQPATLIRATLFDKSTDENWFVPWHQDRTVPLSHKFEKDDWTNWTEKRGTIYAEAPGPVLQKMITFRIHLDDAFPENGCLKFIPASHKSKLTTKQQKKLTSGKYHNCRRNAGDAFIMRPLLLHSSNKSSSKAPRKVIHIEYTSYKLDHGINWG